MAIIQEILFKRDFDIHPNYYSFYLALFIHIRSISFIQFYQYARQVQHSRNGIVWFCSAQVLHRSRVLNPHRGSHPGITAPLHISIQRVAHHHAAPRLHPEHPEAVVEDGPSRLLLRKVSTHYDKVKELLAPRRGDLLPLRLALPVGEQQQFVPRSQGLQQRADLRAEAEALQTAAFPEVVAFTGQRSGTGAGGGLLDAALPVVHPQRVYGAARRGVEGLPQQSVFERFVDAAYGDVIEATCLPQVVAGLIRKNMNPPLM